jgi:drug/metabolite transporter (DMT)-like permease
VKLIYQAKVDVPTLLVVRFVTGAVVLWVIVLSLQIPRGPSFRLMLLGAVGVAVPSAAFLQALNLLPVSTAVLLVYIYPTLVGVFAIASGRERSPGRTMGLLLLSMLGLLLLLGWPSQKASGLGVAFALMTAVGTAGYIIVAEKAVQDVHPLYGAAVMLTGGAVALSLGAAIVGGVRLPQTTSAWALLALLGAVLLPVIYVGMVAALVRIGPARTAIGGTLEPLIATLLGVTVLGERLTLPGRAGGLLIVSSAVLFLLVVRVKSIEP